MIGGLPLLDILLVLLLLWLAWRLLYVSDLFSATVLFIAFGLVMSLAWVRLRAPDLALAEAAIGAGITGAMVLTAMGRLGGRRAHRLKRGFSLASLADLLPAVGALAVLAALAWAVWLLPPERAGLFPEVAARLVESGVTNPVTAVLLNFRGYDTLLELGVLFLAVLGAWSMGEAQAPLLEEPGDPLLALVRTFLPLLVMVAAYLLWLGSHAPGGALQAGAVLAAAGILALLVDIRPPPYLTGWPLRAVLGSCLAFFLAAAMAMTGGGGHFLEYPQGWAKGFILLIEAVMTLSVAATFVLLFAGGRPPSGSAGDRDKSR
jgi:multisubunit Na+/H+ antiporter MnhB subunit